MKKNLLLVECLLLGLTVFCCNTGESDDKSLVSTHPKLEKQLEKDSIRTPITSHENPGLYQRYRITMEKLEIESDFLVTEKYTGKLPPLQVKSLPEARIFETALRKGMHEGINFAGKYTVVTAGCGTACQQHFIIDRQSGNVTDQIQSSAGARFSAGSRIFIINPPDAAVDYDKCRYCTPAAYVIENGKLRKISTDDL